MENVLLALDYVFSLGFQLYCIILFFLSVKKCFWKGDKNRVLLFLLIFFTSPLVSFVVATFLGVVLYGYVLLPAVYYLAGWVFPEITSTFVTACLYSIIMTVLALLYALACGKWLGIKNKYPVMFLYVMYYTFYSVSVRDAGNGTFLSIPGLRNGINVIGAISMFVAIWWFYRLENKAFSELSEVEANVNWKYFVIPPVIYLLLYNTGAFLMVMYQDEMLVLTVFLFTTIIMFLFIWAFHVIIKNVIATNTAVKAKNEVKTLSVEVMEALAHTIDAKDEYTRGHSVRVAKYSRMIAEKMGLSQTECENVYYMGLLHDIGKIGVPNSIINSKKKLSEEEYSVIKTHPGVGYDILAEIKSRPDLSIGARWHHERYDGTGYPDGKAGEDIPLWARIIAVADSYDAMTSNRSYRNYLSQETVREELIKNSGTQFDPQIAKVMLMIMDEDKNYVMHE